MWKIKMYLLTFWMWMKDVPADICYENCSEGTVCEECGWWRAIA